MADIFGELRSLTQEAPSQETFDGIWTLLRKQKVERLEREFIPYALSQLSRWPPGLRSIAHREQMPFVRPGDHDPRLVALLALVDTLNFSHHTNLGDAEIAHFVAHPLTPNIQRLSIANPRWTQQGIRTLAEAELPGLVTLELQSALRTQETTHAMLCTSSWGPRLRSLTLLNWRDIQLDVGALCAHGMPALEELHSRNTEDTPVGFVAKLTTGQAWERLRVLHISHDRYDDYGRQEDEALVGDFDATKLPVLHRLSVRNVGEDSGYQLLRFLQEHKELELSEFYLEEAWLYEDATEVLWGGDFPDTLESLELINVQFPLSPEDVLDTPHFQRLRQLKLTGLGMGDEVAEALAQNPSLENLKTLCVRGCKLTSEGLLALLDGPWELETFDFGNNVIRRAGWDQMLEALADKGISYVNADGTHINDTHVMKLGGLSSVQTLTFLPGDLSLHGLVELCFSPNLGEGARASMRAHVLSQTTGKGRYKILRKVDPSTLVTSRATKTQVQKALVTATHTREAFARAVCVEEYVGALTQKQIKATLKRLGVKGYSKLRHGGAKVKLLEELAASEDPLQVSSSTM